jgi:hypothetical protein
LLYATMPWRQVTKPFSASLRMLEQVDVLNDLAP